METVNIPGGTAVMLNKAAELTPRRRRPIELLSTRVGRKVEQLATASRVLCDGDVIIDNSGKVGDDGEPVFTGGDVEVTERELALVMRLNDVMALSLLVSWTIGHPLPKTEDEFQEIPVPVFDALRGHAARINAAIRGGGDGFTVDAVEDKASPTGG